MNNNTLAKIASSILDGTVGVGRWETYDRKAFKPIEDFLPGLSVGDVVYGYNEDEIALEKEVVAYVQDGVAYYAWHCRRDGPTLIPIGTGYSHTKEEAVKLNRKLIAADIDYARRQYEKAKELEALIKECNES